MNAHGISKFRLEVCSFEWSSHPTSVAPPRGGAAGGGLWRAFGCASLAEAGECGACAPGAGPAICPGWRSGGVASRWARAVPIGVLVASPRERRRSLMCRSISCRSGFTGDPFCERASASQPRHRCAAARAPLLCALRLNLLHRMEQDYPLNLSISLSGGKETNRDAPSNGE